MSSADHRLQRRLPAGFTLMEVLIALVIMALMSGMAFRGLSAVLDSRERLAAENRKWRDIALLFTRFEQDLTAAVNRRIRDTNNLVIPAFVGKTDPVGAYDAHLYFSRMGAGDQTGAMSDIQRVGFRYREGAIEQLLWPVLDQAPRSKPAVIELMRGVKEFEVRYLDRTGTLQTRWPVTAQANPMPTAVQIIVGLASGERFTRIFLLP
ncbi:MAG: type II secretion system minor pseudopilin GspJ [Pseudomonadota bacterium]|nr:type II secretion system minor pseudopilin GspJ [Burkholderiales bacterium]MDQ3195518.1 type II secretion system minor pseudopilin GspJ [Pseudomonadota bacterium]